MCEAFKQEVRTIFVLFSQQKAILFLTLSRHVAFLCLGLLTLGISSLSLGHGKKLVVFKTFYPRRWWGDQAKKFFRRDLRLKIKDGR